MGHHGLPSSIGRTPLSEEYILGVYMSFQTLYVTSVTARSESDHFTGCVL